MPSTTSSSEPVLLSTTFYPRGTRAASGDFVFDTERRRILRSDSVSLPQGVFHVADPVVFHCPRCNTNQYRPVSSNVVTGRRDTQRWCNACTASQTWECGNCEEQISDSLPASDNHPDHDCVCPRCVTANPDIYGRLLNYSNKEVGNVKPEQGDGILFGLEVEVHVKRNYSINDIITRLHNGVGPGYYVTKSDGSLDHGFEIVTRPDGMGAHRKMWQKFFEVIDADSVLKDHLRSSTAPRNCCGMHSHIDKSMLSPLHLGKLRTFLNSPHTRSFVVRVAGRNENTYTQFDGSAKIKDGRNLKTGTSPNRYQALNVGQSTVEVRIFRGTLNPPDFFRNLDFLEAIVHWTGLGNSSLRDVESVPAFARFVRKNAAHFPFLVDSLNEWNIQSAPAEK